MPDSTAATSDHHMTERGCFGLLPVGRHMTSRTKTEREREITWNKSTNIFPPLVLCCCDLPFSAPYKTTNPAGDRKRECASELAEREKKHPPDIPA